jgi:hypothetical protein
MRLESLLDEQPLTFRSENWKKSTDIKALKPMGAE